MKSSMTVAIVTAVVLATIFNFVLPTSVDLADDFRLQNLTSTTTNITQDDSKPRTKNLDDGKRSPILLVVAMSFLAIFVIIYLFILPAISGKEARNNAASWERPHLRCPECDRVHWERDASTVTFEDIAQIVVSIFPPPGFPQDRFYYHDAEQPPQRTRG